VNIAAQWLTRRAGAREVERKLKTQTPASAFDYLLREPRHARRQRRMLHITSGFVALSAIACLLYGCAW
jgi:hypothetical protein